MNDYYTDFEELRPIGEASHIPDEKLSECGDSAAHRQRVATTEKGIRTTRLNQTRVSVLWGVSPRRADEMPVLSH